MSSEQTRQVQTFRIDPDDKSRVQEYAEDHGISESEAYRRLIRKGLDVEQSEVTVTVGDQANTTTFGQPVTLIQLIGTLLGFSILFYVIQVVVL